MFKNVNQYSSDAYRSEQAVDLAINKLTLLAEPLQKRVEFKNISNIHHYQDPKACIEGGRIGDEYRLADTYATWNFIERYMDTSQPLPDIPALEIWRQSDLASQACDAQSGRNPRYWRDMSMDEAEQVFTAQSLLTYQLACSA